MTLMQVFNPGAGNVATREAFAIGRGARTAPRSDDRAAAPVPAFRDALRQSRQRLERGRPDDAGKPADAAQADRSAKPARDDKPQDTTTDTSPAEPSTPRDSKATHASQDKSEPSNNTQRATESADDASMPTHRDANPDAPPTDTDAAMAELQAIVEQLLQQAQPTTAPTEGAMNANPSADDADSLTTTLMSALQGGGMNVKPAAAEGDTLEMTMRQLMAQTPTAAGDRLAALAGMLQAQGQGQGIDQAFDAIAVAASTAGESTSGMKQNLGQLINTMPWLAQAAGQGAKGDATGKMSLEAMLAQLATAATASSQPAAGGEGVTPAVASAQSGGQTLGNALAGGTPGQPMMSEADMQANASRMARAMNSAVNQGSGTLTVRMTPPEMGTVRIQLQMQAGTVNATLHAEGEGARTLLSQQLSQLRQSLEGQGLTVERLSVQSMNGSASSQTQNHSDGSPNEGRSRGEHGGSSGRRQDGHPQDGSPRQRDDAFEQALNEMG